jgi:hypothetical protein
MFLFNPDGFGWGGCVLRLGVKGRNAMVDRITGICSRFVLAFGHNASYFNVDHELRGSRWTQLQRSSLG